MDKIEIVDYKPEYQKDFERLNNHWIEKHFELEEIDRFILQNPEEAILKNGGKIFFASFNNHIIGTVALNNLGNGIMEFAKMAVDDNFHGLGAGKALCESAITYAKNLNIKKLVLYSHTKLKAAIAIYHKYGFVARPITDKKYKRPDIYMELIIQ
ncbi:GNAT family N-acetyltransferase [Pseudopedobacter beijingensis]|uniref:GNAT family N-acetyltransferase n=1 Tax=Pseudopedobacter beijingensis TaxID=1207056 RepID=A0ABW4IE61_9SPHI